MKLEIYKDYQLAFSTDLVRPLELGRQRSKDPPPYAMVPADPIHRLIVADQTDVRISRTQMQIHPQGDGQIRLIKIGRGSPISITEGQIVDRQKMHDDIRLPVCFDVGDLQIKISTGQGPDEITMLGHQTMPPLSIMAGRDPLSLPVLQQSGEFSADDLAKWLNAMLQVFQDTAGKQEFFDRAAESMVKILNLDNAAVLFCEGNDWTVKACHSSNGPVHEDWFPSRTILDRVRVDKTALRKVPNTMDLTASLMDVVQLVAAPVLNAAGDVIGAVYGDCKLEFSDSQQEFSNIETMFVELIASGVATALARLEQERQIAKAQIRFEQFFTPELAQRLETDPDMLSGRNANVSVLFCDIRGFSRISERLGPAKTIEWINGVMNDLSDCVTDHQGVLVDYIGDELMALWGAPEDQPNHAELATRAAISMIERLPVINQRWEQEIGEPVCVGIGINSGSAHVGNTGSDRKFKYGPLGNTVNVASRLQGATKQAKVSALITKATAADLPPDITLRKICQIQFVNVQRPETVFELVVTKDAGSSKLKQEYESGLDLYESGNMVAACKQLASVVDQFPEDGPALLLLSRAVESLRNEGSSTSDTVWKLDRK